MSATFTNSETTSRNGRASLFDPVRKLIDSSLALIQNRIELFQVEVQEEKLRVIELVFFGAMTVVLGTLALALAAFAIVIVVWQSGSIMLLPITIAVYSTGSYLAWRAVRRRLNAEPPFAETAEELKEDRECINGKR